MGMNSAPIPTNHRIKPDEQQRINNIEALTQSEIKELYNGHRKQPTQTAAS
jgi:hypothetical protein